MVNPLLRVNPQWAALPPECKVLRVANRLWERPLVGLPDSRRRVCRRLKAVCLCARRWVALRCSHRRNLLWAGRRRAVCRLLAVLLGCLRVAPSGLWAAPDR